MRDQDPKLFPSLHATMPQPSSNFQEGAWKKVAIQQFVMHVTGTFPHFHNSFPNFDWDFDCSVHAAIAWSSTARNTVWRLSSHSSTFECSMLIMVYAAAGTCDSGGDSMVDEGCQRGPCTTMVRKVLDGTAWELQQS